MSALHTAKAQGERERGKKGEQEIENEPEWKIWQIRHLHNRNTMLARKFRAKYPHVFTTAMSARRRGKRTLMGTIMCTYCYKETAIFNCYSCLTINANCNLVRLHHANESKQKHSCTQRKLTKASDCCCTRGKGMQLAAQNMHLHLY